MSDSDGNDQPPKDPETPPEPRPTLQLVTSNRITRTGRAGGRRKGELNKTTRARILIGKEVLRTLERGDPDRKIEPALDRWAKLVNHRNGFVRVTAEKFVWEALHGKARQTVDVNVNTERAHAIREATEKIRAQRALAAGVVEAEIVPGESER